MAQIKVNRWEGRRPDLIYYEGEEGHRADAFIKAGYSRKIQHLHTVYSDTSHGFYDLDELINDENNSCIIYLYDTLNCIYEYYCDTYTQRRECLSHLMDYMWKRLQIEESLKRLHESLP